VPEVTTRKEFEDWLKGQSKETCVKIATRAALRVLPIVTHFAIPNENRATLALLTLRCILTSGVGVRTQTPEVIGRAALAAAYAAANAAGAAADASLAAAFADGVAEAPDADLFQIQLWPDGRQPDEITSALIVHPDLLDSGPVWSFWQRWYRGMLDGQPIDWKLQEEVALIPS
jgi:hypothetical protein